MCVLGVRECAWCVGGGWESKVPGQPSMNLIHGDFPKRVQLCARLGLGCFACSWCGWHPVEEFNICDWCTGWCTKRGRKDNVWCVNFNLPGSWAFSWSYPCGRASCVLPCGHGTWRQQIPAWPCSPRDEPCLGGWGGRLSQYGAIVYTPTIRTKIYGRLCTLRRYITNIHDI